MKFRQCLHFVSLPYLNQKNWTLNVPIHKQEALQSRPSLHFSLLISLFIDLWRFLTKELSCNIRTQLGRSSLIGPAELCSDLMVFCCCYLIGWMINVAQRVCIFINKMGDIWKTYRCDLVKARLLHTYKYNKTRLPTGLFTCSPWYAAFKNYSCHITVVENEWYWKL